MIKIDAPDAVTIRDQLLEGRIHAEEVVRASLARIEALEPQLHAWAALDPELALAQARAVDRGLDAHHLPGLLGGVPLGVKDIFDTADLPTACGSPIYAGRRPAADAHAVAAARAAGAVVMGKTVTTEFAYFSPGPTANPWDTARTPGGSSSGSAAAVASGMVPLAFGSQTAGSLIRPASYCGVFALKPSHGDFSLAGVKPFAPSLDTMGWLARSADDLELMRCALAGLPFHPLAVNGALPLRLAACPTHEYALLEPAGIAAWTQGLDRIQRAGQACPLQAPPAELAGLVAAQQTVMAWEAARSLATEFRMQEALLSEPLRALIRRGIDTSLTDYEAARQRAQQARAFLQSWWQDLDALLVPAAPGEAPLGLQATGDPVFSRVWTLLGLPCVNVPGLKGPAGMPIGLQLVGPPGGERRLLQAAAWLHERLLAET